mmetsp:Transcript_53087/g.164450  ORF Transcript_53087/g.164450 Transcript_53087/m.164450 type:complete len:292 (-) Transcript_53087:81-956(-)
MASMEEPFLESDRVGRRCRWAWALGGTLLSGLLVLSATRGPEPLAARVQALAVAKVAKVTVEVYGMAGCPFTRGFIEGSLAETLAVVPDLIDLQFHPFGNNYYVTDECGGTAEGMPYASYFKGYNATARQCWDELCGANAKEPAKDCFSGPLVSQHGVTDGLVTTAWACAKSMASGVAVLYMPFVFCTAQRFLGITTEASLEQAVFACAPGFVGQELMACVSGPQGRRLLNEQARATKPHPGVPYVIVDGKVLDDTGCVACGDGIMQKVCEAARAKGLPDTPACKGIFGEV